jgi:hypothetical protein
MTAVLNARMTCFKGFETLCASLVIAYYVLLTEAHEMYTHMGGRVRRSLCPSDHPL